MRKVSHLGGESCAKCGSRIKLADVQQGGERGDLHVEVHQCTECNAAGNVLYEPPSPVYRVYGDVFGEMELSFTADGRLDIDTDKW